MQQKKYSDCLKAVILLKYNNRAIETAQVIEELIEMAKAFQDAMARDDAPFKLLDEMLRDALAEMKVQSVNWATYACESWPLKSHGNSCVNPPP